MSSFTCTICKEPLETPAPFFGESDNSSQLAGPSRPQEILTSPGSPEYRSQVCVVPTCGHIFHRICLVRWLEGRKNKKCPSCEKILILSAPEVRRREKAIASIRRIYDSCANIQQLQSVLTNTNKHDTSRESTQNIYESPSSSDTTSESSDSDNSLNDLNVSSTAPSESILKELTSEFSVNLPNPIFHFQGSTTAISVEEPMDLSNKKSSPAVRDPTPCSSQGDILNCETITGSNDNHPSVNTWKPLSDHSYARKAELVENTLPPFYVIVVPLGLVQTNSTVLVSNNTEDSDGSGQSTEIISNSDNTNHSRETPVSAITTESGVDGGNGAYFLNTTGNENGVALALTGPFVFQGYSTEFPNPSQPANTTFEIRSNSWPSNASKSHAVSSSVSKITFSEKGTQTISTTDKSTNTHRGEMYDWEHKE